MDILCCVLLIHTGVIGIGFIFVAVSILDIGTLSIVEAARAYGCGSLFNFCVLLIIGGVIVGGACLIKRLRNKKLIIGKHHSR